MFFKNQMRTGFGPVPKLNRVSWMLKSRPKHRFDPMRCLSCIDRTLINTVGAAGV